MLIWKTSGPQIWDSSVNPPLNRTKASWEEYFFVMSNALKPQPGATKKTKTQRGGHAWRKLGRDCTTPFDTGH